MKNLAAERDTLRRQNSDNNSYATSFAKKLFYLTSSVFLRSLTAEQKKTSNSAIYLTTFLTYKSRQLTCSLQLGKISNFTRQIKYNTTDDISILPQNNITTNNIMISVSQI